MQPCPLCWYKPSLIYVRAALPLPCFKGIPPSAIEPFSVCTDRFLHQFTERVDLNTRAYFAWVYTARWLGLRMDTVVIMVLTASCFFSVAVNEYSASVGEDNGFVQLEKCFPLDAAAQDGDAWFLQHSLCCVVVDAWEQ